MPRVAFRSCWWKTFRSLRKGGEGGRRREKGRKRRGEKREERSPPLNHLLLTLLPPPLSLSVLILFVQYRTIWYCYSSVVVVFLGATTQEVVLPFHIILQPKMHEGIVNIGAWQMLAALLKDMYERVWGAELVIVATIRLLLPWFGTPSDQRWNNSKLKCWYVVVLLN